MEQKVYRQDADYARQKDEIALYRDSNRLNSACAEAIDKAIHDNNYELYRYDLNTAAKKVIGEYGAERVAWVLAATLQNLEHDGRFSHDNKNWGKGISVPQNRSVYYTVKTHPAVLDGFIDAARKVFTEIESKLKHIADYIIQEGTQNTTEGNWIVGFDEIPANLGGADFIRAHQNTIFSLLEENTEIVADVHLSKERFDVCYYLNHCPNVEVGNDEIPTAEEPSLHAPVSIQEKTSILAQLREGKKDAAHETEQKKSTRKRDSGREV